MEKTETPEYEVIITDTAEIYFYELAEYLYEYYSLNRAEDILEDIQHTTESLSFFPEKGSVESKLAHLKNKYRFILYRRTSTTTIKIIYYIDKVVKKVFVTDFFPTEKDDQEILKRNKGE
ncbi:MAG: hypothetical protein WD048_13835 [Chitinophagales bacterium]